MMIQPEQMYTATVVMENGEVFTIELYPKEAPVTVNNFVFLAKEGFYDGVTFHRVIEGFMAQGGDPTGTGTGGPGYTFDNEPSPLRRHDSAGTLSMANSGPNSGGSQFFVTLAATAWLDGKHAVFGKVIEGIETVRTIGGTATGPGDRPLESVVMEGVRITSTE